MRDDKHLLRRRRSEDRLYHPLVERTARRRRPAGLRVESSTGPTHEFKYASTRSQIEAEEIPFP